MKKVIDFFRLKKTAKSPFDNMTPAEIADKLNSEKDLIKERLKYAMDVFYSNPSKENQYAIFNELVYMVVYRNILLITTELQNNKPTFELRHHPVVGWTYIAYTDADEIKIDSPNIGVIQTKIMLERVASDDAASGMVLNPEHSAQTGVLVFLTKENAKNILRIADESIQDQPEAVRRILMKERN